MKKITIKKLVLYKCTDRKGVDALPEPDMLRYDVCFTSEKNPNFVLFINEDKPTLARWDSFWQDLKKIGTLGIVNLKDWHTYKDNRGLEKQTAVDHLIELVKLQWTWKPYGYTAKDVEFVLKTNMKGYSFGTIEDYLNSCKGCGFYFIHEQQNICPVCGAEREQRR